MVIVLSLLFVAFLFGVWMGLNFYRRATVKDTANIRFVRRSARSRTTAL